MGTRSLTHVKDDVWDFKDTPKTIVTIYRQMDGYLSGMGKDLAEFLAGATIVNGIGSGDTGKTFNGMGEMAAHLVRHLKEENDSGNIYLYPPDSENVGEEYVYTISNRATRQGSALNFTVETTYPTRTVVYDGPPEDFDVEAIEKAIEKAMAAGEKSEIETQSYVVDIFIPLSVSVSARKGDEEMAQSMAEDIFREEGIETQLRDFLDVSSFYVGNAEHRYEVGEG